MSQRFMFRYLLFPLLVLLLTACDQEAMFEKSVPQDESAFSKEIISKLAARDFAAVELRLDSKLQTPDTREKFEQMAATMPAAQATSVRMVGAVTNTMNSVTTYNLTYEYEYPQAWVLINTVVGRQDGKLNG